MVHEQALSQVEIEVLHSCKQALKDICAMLTSNSGPNTLVGFGDWSNKDSAGVKKKSLAGPIKRVENALREECKVISFDDFKTSKLHHECGSPLKHCHSHRQERKSVRRHFKEESL